MQQNDENVEESSSFFTKNEENLTKKDERYDLIDSVMDTVGFGRFQVKVLCLTGFGTFVDALEASLISILYPIFLQEKFATSSYQLALVSSLQYVGMFLGAIFLGILSDKLGRRFVYLFSLFFVIIFGFGSSFAEDIVTFAILRLFLGFGYGGNNITATNLMMELMPTEKRGFGSSIQALSWGLGFLTISAIAWIGGNNLDWRWLVRIPSFIAIPILIAVFWLPESPRFYVHIDDNERLLQSLNEISTSNGQSLPMEITVEQLKVMRTSKVLKRSEHVCATAFDSIIQIFCSKQLILLMLPIGLVWLFNGIGAVLLQWIPLNASYITGPDNPTSIYIVAFIAACGVCIASLTGLYSGQKIKRPIVVRVGLFLSTIFAFIIAFTKAINGYYAVTFFLAFAHQITNSALFLYTPEMLPTKVRSTGFGICYALFRVGPIFGPFIAASLVTPTTFEYIGSVFASFFLIGFIFSFCTNTNTVNMALKENIKE